MTDVPNSELDICDMCKQTRTWHRNNTPRHPFTPLGQSGALFNTNDDAETLQDVPGDHIVPMRTPFDPVLRTALIDKGLVTVEDLEAAERKIRILSQGLGGDSSGQQVRESDERH